MALRNIVEKDGAGSDILRKHCRSVGSVIKVFAMTAASTGVNETNARKAGLDVDTALTTLMVNARHLFYGISMVDKYKNAGKAKPYLIYALSDETYSLVCVDMDMEEGERNKFCLFVTALDQFYWVLGSVLGSLLGAVISFNTEGMDFALTALFVTVFVEQWLSTRDHAAAIVGVGTSVICLVLFGSGSFLIPSMVAITLALTLMRKRQEAVQ